MIYTDSGKYAIRAMTYLASRLEERQGPVPSGEVAQAEDIPSAYLAKVLQDLARSGLLRSVRGRHGGFSLTRPAAQITVLEVLNAVEDMERLARRCILGLDDCTDLVPCPMHETWKAFRESLLEQLATSTVADLVQELERKRRRLGKLRTADEPAPALGN